MPIGGQGDAPLLACYPGAAAHLRQQQPEPGGGVACGGWLGCGILT